MNQGKIIFSQVMGHLPHKTFAACVKRYDGERYVKRFSCMDQYYCMAFAQLAYRESLRDIECCLRAHQSKLYHMGIRSRISKSTLADANERRDWRIWADLASALIAETRSLYAHDSFGIELEQTVYAFDSTVISLCLSLFPWAEFRRKKGGVKVHALLDHDSYMPVFVHIQKAKRHEVKIARRLRLNPGSIIAMDMAYTDYDLFADWTERGVFFVTRQKSNAAFDIVETRTPPQNRNILFDEIIRYTGTITSRKCPRPMRRVVVWYSENEREIVLLTNHLDFGATTIAAIYKDRWEIELFFKALKQNLKVKTFVGTSENALMIQIWTALIALLLIKWMHHISKAGWSISIMASMLRLNLFTYRDLMTWIHDPWNIEPLIPKPKQLSLPLTAFGQPDASKTST